jgi:outer membrane protein TolC
VEDYSESSSAGLVIRQKLGFTGGTFTIGSNLNFLRQFSSKQNSFNSTPFSMDYSQQFFGGNKTNKLEKKAEFKKNEESIKQYCSNISEIQRQALSLFMNVFLAKLEGDLSIENQEITDTLSYIAKIRLDNGGITEYDYKQVELQALDSKYANENAKKMYQESLQNLITFLGITNGEDEKFIISTPEFNLPVSIDLEVVSYYVNKNNPFTLSQEIKRLEAEKNLLTSKLSTRLNGNLSLNYGMNQYAKTFNDVYQQPNIRQGINISLQIPVFQWGINKNTMYIAENNYKSSVISINKANVEFKNDLRNKVNSYNHNIHLWFIAEKAYHLTQEQYKMLTQKFSLGQASVYDLVTVQQQQLTAMQKYYSAINDVWTSYFSLRNAALFDFASQMELMDILIVKNK